MQLITLTTDFGLRDWFVGTMKGVIHRIAPRAVIVDITHEIPPGDIRSGAFALAAAWRFFPTGSVHVAIVDPGVGSARAAIAVRTARGTFVGPDNGVLSSALVGESILGIRRLTNERFFLTPLSHTFHGRDVFAPVAAHLCRGARFDTLGPEAEDFVRLPQAPPRRCGGTIQGRVLYVDRFGNAITNIPNAWIESARAGIFLRGKRIGPLASFYQAVPRGRAVGVPGSTGFLEVAVNGGNAAKRFGLKPGTAVRVRLEPR
ncbi:MAG: SAM-dependent chlorinase/fluorinase [Verrucomicrobiae bacterium]|nr:SAM-dependent chlorinase/fluorinase [Verrucomicrobiae bacterium]